MNEAMTTVTGNISTELTDRRVGAGDIPLVSFWMISSSRRWDRATESWIDGDKFSAKVKCWRRLGENVLASLTKGDPVVVHGRVSVHEYEKDGERRQSVEIAANSVGPNLEHCTAPARRRKATDDAPAPALTGAADPAPGWRPAAPAPAGTGVGTADVEGGEGELDAEVPVLARSA